MRWLSLFVFLVGCQTAQQKRESLVADRRDKLKPLSTFRPVRCSVEARLTQPALARYREMYPGEDASMLEYTWHARESTCDVQPRADSKTSANYQGFLETAMCVLMQVHWVNSPFDEMTIDAVEEKDARVHIGKSPNGLYLDPTSFSLETRTSKHGTLIAQYERDRGDYLPSRLVQKTRKGTQIVLDDFEWGDEAAGRRMVRSFLISVGEEKPLEHSRVVFKDCRPD